MKPSFVQRIFAACLALVVLVNVGLLSVQPAFAQWATLNPDILASDAGQIIKDEVKGAIREAIISAVTAQLINLISYMANRFASESAIWIATGGNAGNPLYNSLPTRDYIETLTSDAVYEMYNTLVAGNIEGGILPEFGVYVSDDASVLAAMRLGLKASAQPTLPESDYASVKKNFEGYLATIALDEDATTEEKTASILTVVSEGFDPRISEIGAGAQVLFESQQQAYEEAQVKSSDNERTDGFTGVTDPVTGSIFTPASFVQSDLYRSLFNAKESPQRLSEVLLTNSDGLIAIGMNAAGVFTNTLLLTLIDQWRNGLFEQTDPLYSDNYNPFDENSTGSSSGGAEVFNTGTFTPLTVSDFSLLSELSTCPAIFRGSQPGLFNCAIDTSFASAVARANAGAPLTLSEAIEEGYLRGSWPLIPSADTARNQDTKCYTYGFCHSNLVKMRRARLIPVGWELAAESSANSETNPVTLQEVMDGFYQCNSDGELDDEHPWCHLIDPDWVLRFPDTQCRTLAYGQLLESSGVDTRQEECVDIQSCINEDAFGNCTGGYGYCVREQNTWRFRGDSCPAQYASCLSFTDSDGTQTDFLTNTLDYGDCSASNMGCLWYATSKELDEDDAYDWPEVPNLEAADEDENAYQDRIYFNGSVESCDEEDGGCSQIIERDDTLSLNVITNGSFEVDDDSDSWPDSWILSDATYDADNDVGRTGDAAVSAGSSGVVYKYGTVLQQSRFYTFSFYAAQTASGGTDGVNGYLWLTDEDGSQVQLSGTSYQGDCVIDDQDSDGMSETIIIESSTASPSSTSYERYECTFTTPTLTDKALDLYAIASFYGGDVWIDDVQVEQDEDASSYHAGYNTTSLSYDYVKLPPSYLGCTGSASDPDECDNYAGVCTEQDAGCTLYMPTNGDPSVTAVVGEVDECPSVCNGYDTYRQEETLYEPDGAFPVYFIPSSAESCSQEAVGCDEFTNLETEEQEYYTYLRACVTEDQAEESGTGDAAATFYTWEGSDEEGYQLRTWRLLESDLDGYTSGITYAGSLDTDNVPGSAPCSNWQMDTTTGETIECIDDADGDTYLEADTEECDEHSDIIENPDCREFYDVNGEIHYRQWTQTVTVTDSCVAYRKSDTVGDDATEQEDNCEDSGGFWDGDRGDCRYFGYTSESTSCADSEAGCRAYTGGRSGNSRVAFKDVFENDTVANWEVASASDAELSNESVATDGHSLYVDGVDVWTYLYEESGGCSTDGGCTSSGAALGGECTVENGETYCGTLHNQLFTEKTYTLSFWAKGNTDVSVGFDIGFVSASSIAIDAEFGTVELEADWQYFSVGPLDMNENDYGDFGNGTTLVFSPDSSGAFYIDNVTLREGEDNITVIKDSWVTPAVCDENLDGEVSAQFHLGCQEYTDQDLNTTYLKSFSDLCDEDKVGCDAYYVTSETEDVGVAVYNATCYNVDEEETCDSGLCSESRDSCSSAADCNAATWEAGSTSSERTSCYLFTDSDGASFDTDSPVLCTIIAGEDSCQFDFDDWFIPEHLLDSESELFHIEYGPDATFVEADRDAYLIVDSSVRCSSSNAGCEELGQPTFTADLSAVDSWESVYLLNDPESYDDILCSSEELFCAEWDAGSEGTWYFKDPGSHVCEYRTDVTVGGQVYDGWFQEGTSEFCYGTGACSVLDDDGAEISCSSDADCYDTDTDTSYGECDIDTGSYVIGGEDSGIWRNGDDAYDGWVGACQAQYSGCTEFQDLLDFDDDEFYGDTDGHSYYFIDNTALDESNLLSSQRCNGQVSSKFGCALFNDAGDTGLDYNASASYIASARASELFGDRTFALVDPIDCTSSATSTIITPAGEEVDLCAQRCGWYNGSLDSGFDISTITGVEDLVTLGGSCYDDSDCPTHESDLGDLVRGYCNEQIGVDVYGYVDVERLENDSNRVLKVTRDRTCSEWLTCASSYTIWDENDGKYRTICDGIDLCTEYSGDSSSSLCSAWDPDDPAVVFDVDRYVSRDVSWYGEEYAGYSVPDIFPIQHLTQVDTAPPAGFCDRSDTTYSDDPSSTYQTYHGVECESEEDCGGYGATNYCVTEDEDDFQIGYSAGACDEDYAEDCTVGYCEASGSACSDDDDCEDTDDSCITGVCYEVSTTTCEDDDDCSSTQECRAGTCVEETGNCDLDYSCSDAASTCFSSSAAKTGTCYSGTCFVAVNGNQFDDEITEGIACRAQPESNSPFTQDVVTEWKYLDFIGAEGGSATDVELAVADPGEIDLDTIAGSQTLGTDSPEGGALPSKVKSGFDGAQTCAPGEVCECAYYKVSASAGSGYIAYDTAYDDFPITGVCSADSPVAGALCGDDDDCRYYNDTGTVYTSSINDGYVGTCQKFTSEQAFVGLEGYCLERDTGLNINGDPDLGACLTWFPVDQITGATDLYAKYKQAGYFQDTYVCTNTRPTINLYTSKIAGDGAWSDATGDGADVGIACAESDGSVTKSNSYENLIGSASDSACALRANCPDGYYAIVGQAAPDKDWGGGGYAMDCGESGGDNDCPYVCVPINSVHESGDDAGEQCDAPTSSGTSGVVTSKTANAGNPVYTWAKTAGNPGGKSDWQPHLAAFSTVVDTYADCVLKGVDYAEVEDSLTGYDYSSSGLSLSASCDSTSSGSGSSGGYRCLYVHWEVAPGCTEVIQVADSDESYAFTDTLYDGSLSSESAFGYSNDTVPPFGFSSVNPLDIDDNQPILVAACTNDAYDMSSNVTATGLFADASRNYLEYPGSIASCSDTTADTPLDIEGDGVQDPTSAGSPEARSYIKFNWSGVLTSTYEWGLDGESKANLFERVNNLFAKLNIEGDTIFTWDDDDWDSETANPESSSFFNYVRSAWGDDDDYETDYADEIDVRAEMGQSPTVWAVDTDNCGPKYCEEGEESAVTLNNTNEGDVETSGGYYRANLKFFAAADKNQLPIRRVIVDWGDNSSSGSNDPDNYYKNHRGLQDEEEDGVETQTQSKCDLEDEWGKTANSCDPNYFNYSHTYRCWDPTELEFCEESDDGNLVNSPCTFDYDSCVFQPRVHVRDNWGWCTGTCDGDECFDESPLASPSGSGVCNYSRYPNSDTPDTNPWVYYDGYIYVEPN